MPLSLHVTVPLIVALSVAGCQRSATGQVVAVVNNEEISLIELNAELKSLGDVTGNKDAIRAAALQSLIDRKLLVQAARERGIDKDPDVLQGQRRASDQLLIGSLAQQVTKNVPVPTQADIDRYIASNPRAFSGRTIYDLAQVRFNETGDTKVIERLKPTKSMADVVGALNALGVKFVPLRSSLDSAVVPKALLDQVDKVPAGEPFILSSAGTVIVSVIVSKRSVPLAEPEARKLAAESLRRDAIGAIAAKQVKDARARGKIEYQPGFEPKKVS